MKILKIFSKNKTWYDITLEQFNQLSKLGKEPSVYEVIDIIYGVKSKEIPIGELSKYSVAFIGQEIPRTPIKKYYKLNGTKYSANFDITKINGAQFIDFRNYSANGAKLEDILSVCLIPKGHKYNDGYDILKVKEDTLKMKITDAYTIGFFFLLQSLILQEGTLSSLRQQLGEMKDPKIQKVVNQLESLDLSNLILSLYS